MSIRHVGAVFDCMPELDRLEAFVLAAIADSADKESGYCWPSVATIARRARCSRRGAQKVLRRLEQNGYITRKENVGSASMYRILFDVSGQRRSEEELYPQGGANGVRRGGERRSQGGRTGEQGGRTIGSQGGRTGDTPYMRTVIEPSIEPKSGLQNRLKTKSDGPRPPAIAKMLEKLRGSKKTALDAEAANAGGEQGANAGGEQGANAGGEQGANAGGEQAPIRAAGGANG